MAINLKVSGENIHITNSKEKKAVEFTLYGKAKQNTTSGKQLIPFPYADNTPTENGITFTVNSDGSVTANGTATATASFYLSLPLVLQAGTYTVSDNVATANTHTQVYLYASPFTNLATSFVKKTFTLEEETEVTVRINILSGATVSNLTFKPMIRLASITDDTYEPYTNGASPNPSYPQEIEVSGESYNLLENTATSQTINGIEFVVNEDGSVTANGTATALATLPLLTLNNDDFIDGEKYILSGCNGGNNASPYTYLLDLSNYVFIGNGEKEFIFDKSLTYKASISVWQGVTLNNQKFYPMIRKASVKNDRYMPYGKGSVEVISSNVDNTKTTTATIPTENGLAGIKVLSNGNYTDQNGQRWICDEVVKYADGSGAFVQRIGKKIYDGVNNVCSWVGSYVNSKEETIIQMNLKNTDCLFVNSNSVICDKFKSAVWGGSSYAEAYTCRVGDNGDACCTFKESDGITNVATANAWLQENNVTVYYILKEPITTPLTAEELAEISTFYPVTNISNDFDCGMSITYISTLVEFKEPKTDWTEKSRFNIEDYNRIKNNLEWLYQKAVYLNRPFEIEDMGEDIVDYLHYWKVSYFNAFEDNVEIINNNMRTKDYGVTQRFYENGAFISWTELNRIESAILSMKNILDNHEKGLRKIPFVFGRFKEIRL